MAVRGTTKFNSNKQEKRVAEELGGNTVIGSGSLWGAKGDVRTEDYLIECKTTEKKTYSLSTSTWFKIQKEAVNDGLRIPVMCIDLDSGQKRLAVFKKNSILVEDKHFHLVATNNKSIRLGDDNFDYVKVIFSDVEDVNNKPLVLMIIPWDYLLEIMEDM